MNSRNTTWGYGLFLAGIICYLVFSLLTFRTYGITNDEYNVYTRGVGLLQHFTQPFRWESGLNPDLFSRQAIDDGAVYNNIYPMILAYFNPDGNYEIYHLFNLIFALAVFVALYVFLVKVTGDPLSSLSGPLFLFFTPRFLGHIPANPKDIPFAVFYLLTLVGLYMFSQTKHRRIKILVLGVLFGITQSLRLLGVSLYIIYVLFYLSIRLGGRKKSRFRELLADSSDLVFIVIVSMLLTISTWPYLGSNVFGHLGDILALNRTYSWSGTILFSGQKIQSSLLPRRYLPIWIFITTPFFILVLSFLGIFTLKIKRIRPASSLLLLTILINAVLFIAVKPLIYDGLRHYLFILPPIVALSALSFISLTQTLKDQRAKIVLYSLVVVNILFVICSMIRLHPYEYIFFNSAAGGLAREGSQFESDYWGASYREAVLWVIKNEITDPRKTYSIASCGNSVTADFSLTYYFLPNMKFTGQSKNSDFFICSYRYSAYKNFGYTRIIHTVSREGIPLSFVMTR